MPYRDVLAYGHAVLVLHAMQHAAILHIRVRPDADRVYVSAQHRIHPDRRVLAQHHVADNLRRLVDVTGRRKHWLYAFEGSNHELRIPAERTLNIARRYGCQ